MDAYLAEFKVYVIDESKPDVLARLDAWRALAVACGFEPGGGKVSTVKPGELPRSVLGELEKARAKVNGPASPALRSRMLTALASHFDGDLGFAGELVESIEQERGSLPAALANALADSRKPSGAA
jgi:hypothetical protein